MPHIITGEIRKEPRIHNETTFIVELSESYKNREGTREYTNYTFFFNAKTDGLLNWYRDAFQVGKVITVQCDQLKTNIRDHNGTTYVTLQPAGFAQLIFSQRSQQQSGGWGEPQQPQGNQQQRQQQSKPKPQNNPPMDFDDDIPF
ncbi:single strand DNA binding protein [Enterobacter phage Ec_L1]|uniref:Single-stranded DNA-binding protein n=1 Tax=Enterobacter phage Ec_L1 TaxID=2070180 RepID=A0A2P0WA08_9CAUD|nr:single strand DNA binding protein [Enterobacter phage Ec_L1]AUV57196.1 hypothetical protein Ec82 [Enterobacter phage Ec_L1]